jgi:hypothetical protein
VIRIGYVRAQGERPADDGAVVQEKTRHHGNRESAMFDEPPSLALRAALASLLGGLFGIGMLLMTHSVQAQTAEAAASAPTPSASVVTESVAVIRRLGDATLRSMRGAEPAIRGLRVHDHRSEVTTGLRWQPAQRRVLRSEVENPRGNDQISLGLQLSF